MMVKPFFGTGELVYKWFNKYACDGHQASLVYFVKKYISRVSKMPTGAQQHFGIKFF